MRARNAQDVFINPHPVKQVRRKSRLPRRAGLSRSIVAPPDLIA
jgi:hypothetical protein